MTNRSLFMTPAEHESALLAGGFELIEPMREEGGLALFRASSKAT